MGPVTYVLQERSCQMFFGHPERWKTEQNFTPNNK